MKLIVAGTRTFSNYQIVRETLLKFIDDNNVKNLTIFSGQAHGADQLGETFAQEFNLPIKYFPADWKNYGKFAGPIRNKKMADEADYLICFWDCKSRGTLNMINQMKSLNKHGLVIYI